MKSGKIGYIRETREIKETNNINNTARERNLMDAFEELKQARNESIAMNHRKQHNSTYEKIYINKRRKQKQKKQGISLVGMVMGVVMVAGTMSSANFIFASNSNIQEQPAVYEENRENIDIDKIISDNISSTERKELVTEEREIPFKTTYNENPNMPKDEQNIIQQGANGVKTVTVVKIYETAENEDENFLEENILNTTITTPAVEQIIEVGTSELLGKYKVHIGDKMYTTQDIELKDSVAANANVVCKVGKYMDVEVLGVQGNYFNVKYENYTGYVKGDNLVSYYTNPEYAEKCRLQKILNKLSYEINVNEPSGLSLEDFKKVLSNNPKDVNKIFENNAEVFYNLEQKYRINGLFIAALGIHESSWGTSAIAKDKLNLFGYGAYDDTPYESALTFNSYEEGIETVTKSLIKNYLNVAGTEIYDGETATGKYYHGTTISSINIKYATDDNWSNAIYNIMEGLYEKL